MYVAITYDAKTTKELLDLVRTTWTKANPGQDFNMHYPTRRGETDKHGKPAIETAHTTLSGVFDFKSRKEWKTYYKTLTPWLGKRVKQNVIAVAMDQKGGGVHTQLVHQDEVVPFYPEQRQTHCSIAFQLGVPPMHTNHVLKKAKGEILYVPLETPFPIYGQVRKY